MVTGYRRSTGESSACVSEAGQTRHAAVAFPVSLASFDRHLTLPSIPKGPSGRPNIMAQPPLDALEMATAECSSFSIERIQIAERLLVPAHAHDGRHLLIITKGTLVESFEGGDAELREGTIRFSPNSETHRIRIEQVPFSCLVISVREGASSPFPNSAGHEIAQDLLMDANDIHAQMTDASPGALLSVSASTSSLLARAHQVALYRSVLDVPAWLIEVRKALSERASQPVRLDAVAQEAGVHPAHLSRAFRLHFGITPREFLRNVRLASAIDAFRHSSSTLSAIAADCGFADHAHLTRTARAEFGRTPSALRGALQGKVHSSAAS